MQPRRFDTVDILTTSVLPVALVTHRRPRYQVVVPIRYGATASAGTHAQAGWTRDLSETGACLELPEHLSPETRIALVLETESGPIQMGGSVAWVEACDPAGPSHLHGLQFSPAVDDDRGRLCAWLQRYSGQVARLVASLPAKCRTLDGVSPAVEGWTADLGSGGCGLFLPERLPVGTLLEVTLSTPCGDLPGQGVVVWEGRSSGHLVEHGLRFTKLPSEQAGGLGDILEAILAIRAAPGGPTEHGSSSPIV